MKNWAMLLCCSLLAACAEVPPAPPPSGLFDDARFAPPSERIAAADDVFALTDDMKRYFDSDLAEQPRYKDLRQKLMDALDRKGRLKLDYDNSATRTAAQAFEARSGNCLSLVIMTAAFAKHLGLPVRYQRVFIGEAWSRSGDLYFSSGHVNLSLGRPATEPGVLYDQNQWTTIDFVPPAAAERMRSRAIVETEIVAMYMNNRAAEALVRGELDNAYAWARAAIEAAPAFTGAYNTLGVVYLHHGDLALSEVALRRAMAIEPDNAAVLSNLVGLLERAGPSDELQRLKVRLAQLEPDPPFYFFNLGMAAMRSGDYPAAKQWFTREVDRAGYYHEFHFWLAMADFQLGDFKHAGQQLMLAMQNSSTHGEHELYAAKLARLKADFGP